MAFVRTVRAWTGEVVDIRWQHPDGTIRYTRVSEPDWDGFVPPETFNHSRNNAPERQALADIVDDAIEAEAAREAERAAGGEP